MSSWPCLTVQSVFVLPAEHQLLLPQGLAGASPPRVRWDGTPNNEATKSVAEVNAGPYAPRC